MNEIIVYIKAIKLNAWEYAFKKKIEKARR